VPPNVYWRRRVFALAAGLTVLGLLVWAVGGAASARPAASTTSLNSQPPSPTPSPVESTPSPSPLTTSPSPRPSATKTPSTAAKQPGAHDATGLNAPGDDCPAGDVVLSLSANGDSYGTTAHPVFSIDVVSTDRRTCAFNVGSRYLTLLISSGGVRIWGSGDCAASRSQSQVAMLSRGVPEQRTITWDRMISSPGCHVPLTAARAGTYTATASDSGVHSRTVVFQLG
jgi:hypothetical protein